MLCYAQVEYARRPDQAAPLRIATAHAGADLLLRQCYAGSPVRISAFDTRGLPLQRPAAPHHVAGPLCFAGDYPSKDVELPAVEAGDIA
jgi:diaminopimelate decarboxylase